MKKTLSLAALLSLGVSAFAHEGHGIEGASHWHATDTVGLLIAAGAAIVAIWISRGGK